MYLTPSPNYSPTLMCPSLFWIPFRNLDTPNGVSRMFGEGKLGGGTVRSRTVMPFSAIRASWPTPYPTPVAKVLAKNMVGMPSLSATRKGQYCVISWIIKSGEFLPNRSSNGFCQPSMASISRSNVPPRFKSAVDSTPSGNPSMEGSGSSRRSTSGMGLSCLIRLILRGVERKETLRPLASK
ncbi:hypothetical protein SUGI_1129020 [Cryptomeria japonica]|nr:hypothetical protein SUGI_1129020 [Cryptomeria japonica]